MKDNNIFIIAEAGVNHNGSVETALKLVDVAKDSGAHAVKFQTFRADELATAEAEQCEYQQKNAKTKSQLDMLFRLELNHDDHRKIFSHCKNVGIEFMSTAFDPQSLYFLVNEIGIERIKIPSGELVNPLLLFAAGQTGKDIIISTGMADMTEVAAALDIVAFSGLNPGAIPEYSNINGASLSELGRLWLKSHVTLLHCTTVYPAPMETVNLKSMSALENEFGLEIGFSDHTHGIGAAIAATALGARIIEKHFTLDRTMDGPDHKASLEPQELKKMVSEIHNVVAALGSVKKVPVAAELENRRLVRRVLIAARDIEAGEIFNESSIEIKRAGDGISAMQYWAWLGKKANRRYSRHECLKN